jgi:hypothetical protein
MFVSKKLSSKYAGLLVGLLVVLSVRLLLCCLVGLPVELLIDLLIDPLNGFLIYVLDGLPVCHGGRLKYYRGDRMYPRICDRHKGRLN